MKKIVALGAAAALVGALFAAEPASNPSVVEFTGNAEVKWGVDLDAGKTGFKNSTWTRGKFKLFDAGDKSTSGEGLWAELVLKIDADSDVGPNGYVTEAGSNGWKAKNTYIDVAKIHFNDFYVGIKSGDTTVGVLDFNTAVRSGDPWFHPGRWLTGNNVKESVGDYTQGIVAGFDNSNLEVAVDFRSLDYGQYTNAYAVKLTGGLKDSNEFLPGLKVGAGASYNITDTYYGGTEDVAATHNTYEIKWGKPDQSKAPAGVTYTTTGLPAYYDPAVTAFDGTSEGYYIEVKAGAAASTKAGKADAGKVTKHETKTHNFAYAGNFGYKFKIDDKFYVYPQAGINGKVTIDNTTTDVVKTTTDNTVAAGLLFGWGDTASYGSSGLLYFDVNDREKGLTPGVGVVAYIPLANVVDTKSSNPTTVITNNSLQALIVPSFYSGDLIKNFKAGIYSEIGLFNTVTKADKVSGTTTEKWSKVTNEKDAFAFAIAGSLSYALKLNDDAITVTPKLGARYINEAYNNEKATIQGKVPASGASDKPFFVDYGIQGVNNKDFLNISGSVDVAGLINNTTFSVTYVSANLLNDTVYNDPTYNVKAGTLNVGCKISF